MNYPVVTWDMQDEDAVKPWVLYDAAFFPICLKLTVDSFRFLRMKLKPVMDINRVAKLFWLNPQSTSHWNKPKCYSENQFINMFFKSKMLNQLDLGQVTPQSTESMGAPAVEAQLDWELPLTLSKLLYVPIHAQDGTSVPAGESAAACPPDVWARDLWT